MYVLYACSGRTGGYRIFGGNKKVDTRMKITCKMAYVVVPSGRSSRRELRSRRTGDDSDRCFVGSKSTLQVLRYASA